MRQPSVEVADLIRSEGAAFIERNCQWIRWNHVKVLLAIARCRTAALGAHLVPCTRCAPRFRSTVAAIAIAQNVRSLLGGAGSPRVGKNSSPSVDRREVCNKEQHFDSLYVQIEKQSSPGAAI